MNTARNIKRSTKRGLQKIIPSQHEPIIIASMGRSGSTLVYDAVRHAMAIARFGPFASQGLRVVSDPAWDLGSQKYNSGVVYKTHGFAHELPGDCGAKVIFLFGSASDAALSVLACQSKYGDEWIKKHFIHLRANGSFDALAERDVLRFEDQLDSWTSPHGTSRLLLHYDALWECSGTLSEFCGFPVKLPPRRERSGATVADSDTKNRFTATYAKLDSRIADMPRCQVLNPGEGSHKS